MHLFTLLLLLAATVLAPSNSVAADPDVTTCADNAAQVAEMALRRDGFTAELKPAKVGADLSGVSVPIGALSGVHVMCGVDRGGRAALFSAGFSMRADTPVAYDGPTFSKGVNVLAEINTRFGDSMDIAAVSRAASACLMRTPIGPSQATDAPQPVGAFFVACWMTGEGPAVAVLNPRVTRLRR